MLSARIVMPTNETNPYQPPSVPESSFPGSHTAARSYTARATTLLIPPILTLGCTLAFWLGFAYLIPRAAFNHINLIFIWSATLMASLFGATFLIHRVWPQRLSPISIGVAYVLFGIVFCLLEGDTSNGSDLVQASVVYGTLIAAPLIAFALTRMFNRKRFPPSTETDG